MSQRTKRKSKAVEGMGTHVSDSAFPIHGFKHQSWGWGALTCKDEDQSSKPRHSHKRMPSQCGSHLYVVPAHRRQKQNPHSWLTRQLRQTGDLGALGLMRESDSLYEKSDISL